MFLSGSLLSFFPFNSEDGYGIIKNGYSSAIWGSSNWLDIVLLVSCYFPMGPHSVLGEI